jgi:acetyl-CoA synthase
MSKVICTGAIVGAREVVRRADAMLAEAIQANGADHPVGFPDTAYYLPIVYSFTGKKVEKLGDLVGVLQDCHNLLPEPPTEATWLPYLGDALDAGMATLFAFESIEACKTLLGSNPREGIWLGAASDVIMRERGVEFVDGTAPGFAAIVGAAPDAATATKIARELQEKNLYVFMAGSSHGTTFAEQLESEGVQLGWETRLVPFGRDVSAAAYALGFANRAALAFGGVAPGDFERNLLYNRHRIFAFVMALGEVDDEKYAAAAGAINYGLRASASARPTCRSSSAATSHPLSSSSRASISTPSRTVASRSSGPTSTRWRRAPHYRSPSGSRSRGARCRPSSSRFSSDRSTTC